MFYSKPRPVTHRITLRLVAPLLLYASLLLLRQQLVTELHFSFSQAFSFGVYLGWIYDAAVVALPSVFAWLLWGLFKIPIHWSWNLVAFSVWLSSLSNVLYFQFFGSRLDLWIIAFHWKDLLVVDTAAVELAGRWKILVSTVLFILSGIMSFFMKGVLPNQEKKGGKRFTVGMGMALMVLFYAVTIRHIPLWLHLNRKNNILSEQILMVWERQATGKDKESQNTLSLLKKEKNGEALTPGMILAQYRDFHSPETDSKNNEALGALYSENRLLYQNSLPDWPLYTEIHPDKKDSEKLREYLGFPVNKPLNVVMLFMESVRSLEIEHPEIGPLIYPNLLSVLNQYGIYFPKTYTSVFLAGQTVRGQFSTLCSMLPNIKGIAVYLGHPTLNIRCLASVLKEQGYQTIWMNSFHRSFHNKDIFESLHGTEIFYEGKDYQERGVTQMVGDWGLADLPFLEESVKILSDTKITARPFFTNILTISSHYPFSIVSEGEIPEKLSKTTEGHPEYQAYLSRLRYVDKALGHFFDYFFKSKLADDTIIIALGDHSMLTLPHFNLTHEQLMEMRFRIPLAIISKNIRAPKRISFPAHQVDVAPTLLSILGISSKVTWIGKNLFNGEGSPWVYAEGNALSYRTHTKGCYAHTITNDIFCKNIPLTTEPVLETQLTEIDEDKTLSNFFMDVITAGNQAIILNRIAPHLERQ